MKLIFKSTYLFFSLCFHCFLTFNILLTVHFYFYAHESCFIQFGRIFLHEIEQEADDGFSSLHVMFTNYQFMSDNAHDLLKA